VMYATVIQNEDASQPWIRICQRDLAESKRYRSKN
jgi:hypothetical protein